MVKFVEHFLNKITMYRLMLYYLLFLVVWAAVLSFLNILPYRGLDILVSTFYLVAACRIINKIFATIFKVSANLESSLITGLILSLIMGPYNLINNWIPAFAGMSAVAFFAMGSKYVLALKGVPFGNKKHIFNPAAFGAVASALALHHGASWWVGTSWMIVPTLLGGGLILKKISRFQLVGTFLLTYVVFSLLTSHLSFRTFIYSPIIFFACVMLIEPLTSPFSSKFQIIYGILVAVVFNLYGRLPYSSSFPLELSLLTGNIFSYIVSKNFRQTLKLEKIIKESHDVNSFIFEPMKKIQFKAGQYLQWMLPHPRPDSRGVRRYFTIASSPTEEFIMLSTKFYPNLSTFKQALLKLEPGDEIIILDLEGDFTLPANSDKKLCFIAGGIGITPFRSMAKWMIDTSKSRDIVLLFSNKTKEDIVFKDILDKSSEFGWKTIYVNTNSDGYIDENMIKQKVPDWKERLFFVSGPEPMVLAFEKILYGMGLSKSQVKRDYFPGYENEKV